MVNIGGIYKVKQGAPYGITSEGSLVKITGTSSLRGLYEVTLLKASYKGTIRYEGMVFDLDLKYLEPYDVGIDPHLPPLYLKIRKMHARQQAKGILRY